LIDVAELHGTCHVIGTAVRILSASNVLTPTIAR
jgi:hypothetical protein